MKKLLLATAAVSALGLAGLANAADMGVVNVQQIFKNAPQGQAELVAVKSSLKPQITKLEKEHADLLKAVQAFQKNAPTMTAKKKKQEQTALQKKESDLQTKLTAMQHEEYKEGVAAASKFKAALDKAIGKVAKKDDLDLVIMKQAVLYKGHDVKDISSDVVQTMKNAK